MPVVVPPNSRFWTAPLSTVVPLAKPDTVCCPPSEIRAARSVPPWPMFSVATEAVPPVTIVPLAVPPLATSSVTPAETT